PELDIWSTATPILREWMRERTSVRGFLRELRTRAPEMIDAARGLPALLTAAAQRAHHRLPPPAPAPPPERADLRAELRATARRRDAVTLGAALLAGGLVWLAVAHNPQWPGWALIAVGLTQVLYGLWR